MGKGDGIGVSLVVINKGSIQYLRGRTDGCSRHKKLEHVEPYSASPLAYKTKPAVTC